MSVQFTKVVFHNTASVDVTLTVEAPAGHRVAGPQTVTANSSATINPAVSDCASVLLRVISDADPDEETQALSVNLPLSLQTIEVNYFIGSFLPASVTAGTGGAAEPRKVREKKPQ
jgi:hypothetical protein